MVIDELIGLLAIIFIFGVPSLSLAAHFVLRPLVRDIVSALKEQKQVDDPETLRRLDRVEASLDELRSVTHQLLEAERFRQQLEAGRDTERPESADLSGTSMDA